MSFMAQARATEEQEITGRIGVKVLA